MALYRKRPVVVEAFQWTADHTQLEVPEWIMKALQETWGEPGSVCIKSEYHQVPTMLIYTLEGVMTAYPGDFIIKGVNGEIYPCKPDIFFKTYEAVDSPLGDVTAVEITGGGGDSGRMQLDTRRDVMGLNYPVEGAYLGPTTGRLAQGSETARPRAKKSLGLDSPLGSFRNWTSSHQDEKDPDPAINQNKTVLFEPASVEMVKELGGQVRVLQRDFDRLVQRLGLIESRVTNRHSVHD